MGTGDELRSAATDVVAWYEWVKAAGAGWTELAEKIVAVARAYLAEHPADDQMPVDEEWLRAVGFTAADDAHSVFLHIAAPYDPELLVFVHLTDFTADIELAGNGTTERPREVATRGHIRRLCLALGIPLSA